MNTLISDIHLISHTYLLIMLHIHSPHHQSSTMNPRRLGEALRNHGMKDANKEALIELKRSVNGTFPLGVVGRF